MLLFRLPTPSACINLFSCFPDEWLYNGGPYQLVCFHFLIGISAHMGRQWNSPTAWACAPDRVAYSAPLFSDGCFPGLPLRSGALSSMPPALRYFQPHVMFQPVTILMPFHMPSGAGGSLFSAMHGSCDFFP